MWVHMAGLMRDSVRPWGVSSSKSGEGSSVARAAFNDTTPQWTAHESSQKTNDQSEDISTTSSAQSFFTHTRQKIHYMQRTTTMWYTEQASPRAASASMMRFTQSSCSTLRGICPVVTAATKATTSATRLMVSWNCRQDDAKLSHSGCIKFVSGLASVLLNLLPRRHCKCPKILGRPAMQEMHVV